jgi:hypothetical protein
LVVALGLRAGLAWYDHSVFWPDEIHQSLEQAHRAVFGYGLVPWEFRDGARNWLFPGAIAALWKLAAALGVDSSMALIMLARLLLVASSVVAVWFAGKLARTSGGLRASLAAVLILATFPPAVVFSYRAMSETASAPLIMLGAWYLSRRTLRAAGIAGACLAIAFLFRYQNGLFLVFFGAALLLQRRWREALVFAQMGVAIGLLGGALDWLTWGRPFHSLLAYVDFNLLRSGASSFGVEPFDFYARTLWTSVGPLLPMLAACFAVGSFVHPVLGGAVLAYILAHSVLPHKELRFIVPCLPLFAAVAGIGVERILRRLPAPRAIGIASGVLLTGGFAHVLFHLTYADMGQYTGTPRASLSVWKTEEEASLLLVDAGKRPDVCGVTVLGARAAFTGGYTYLHREVPLSYESELCSIAPSNYVIAPTVPGTRPLPSSYRLQVERGPWGLFRRDGACRMPTGAEAYMLEGAADMGLVRRKAQQAADGSLRFDVQRDSGAFSEGWGHGEVVDCIAARWVAGKRAIMDFDFTPAGPAYKLNLRGRAHERLSAQRINVEVNGQRILAGLMPRQMTTYSLDIPDGTLRPGQNRIEFRFSRTERASPNDTRELAAQFRQIEIVPMHDDFEVDIAGPDSRKHLVRGFHPVESTGEMTFAWSDGPASEVEGDLAWPRSAYVLETVAEALPLLASQRTRVFANDILVGTLEYAHRWTSQRLVIAPSALKKGKNRIRFEYEASVRPAVFDKKLREQRELAVRFRKIQLTPLSAPTDLDLGSPNARAFLLDGWSGDEQDGERSVVWSNGRRASVALSLQGVKQPVLRLTAHGYAQALPISVSVHLNDERIGVFAAPESWQDISVPLPARDYSGTGEILSLDFDHTARPSIQDPQSRDSRDLALRVDRLWVESAASTSTINASVQALEPQRESSRGGIASGSLEARK